MVYISEGSVSKIHEQQHYFNVFTSLLKNNNFKCSIVNLLKRNNVAINSILQRAMGDLSNVMNPVIEMDPDSPVHVIDKLGDSIRKESECSIIVAEVKDYHDISGQVKQLENIYFVAKKIRSGFVCLVETTLNPSLNLTKFGKRKIITKAFGSFLRMDLICPFETGRPINSHLLGSKFSNISIGSMLKSFEFCAHPLRGKTMIVGSLGETPLLFIDQNRTIQRNLKNQPEGTNNGVYDVFARVLGFNYTTKIATVLNHYNVTTQKWGGMAGDILDGNLDFGLTPQAYLRKLLSVVDYSNYVYVYILTITCCQPRRLTGFYNIIRPFGFELWAAVFGSIVIVGLTFILIYQHLVGYQHTMAIKLTKKQKLFFLFDSLQSLIQYSDVSSFRKKGSFSSANLMVLVWSLTGMLIVFSYTCTLRSSLIYKPTTKSPTTIQEAINTGLVLFIPDRSSTLMELAGSNIAINRKMYNHIIKTKGVYPYGTGAPKQIMEAVANCEAHTIHLKTATPFFAYPGYKDKFGRRIYNKTNTIKEDFSQSFAGLLLPLHSEYTSDLNRILSRIHSGGLMNHFTNNPLPLEFTMDARIFNINEDLNEKILFENLQLIFAIWVFGMFLALFLFACEKYVVKKNQN